MQRTAVERAASLRGDPLDAFYSEKASARTIDRPELERLRADVRARRVRRVYVFRLDRLTRTGIRDTFEIVEEMRDHEVELITVADGFDLTGPAAELVLAMMAWAAKMERLAINERIAAARDRVEARGGKWGRPRRMQDDLTMRAIEMQREGRSVRAIAVALKVPRSTIARAIKVVART